ncbi:MAG: hypothetical protein LBR66_04130 [Candidatus Symbiothrix sp.]|jgi:hypothetical protein|nr:hypothetical protein [Candidatus Symbiothrix sp.]
MMKKKSLLIFVYCAFAVLAARAQVNIGTPKEAHRAAVLHMGTSLTTGLPDTLGMKLTVVHLPDTAHLNLGPPGSALYLSDIDEAAMGMVVYNLSGDPCGTGGLTPCLYVWNGGNWMPLGCSFRQPTYSGATDFSICPGDNDTDYFPYDAAYSYTWSPSIDNSTVGGPTNYNVSITDAAGCSTTVAVTITVRSDCGVIPANAPTISCANIKLL